MYIWSRIDLSNIQIKNESLYVKIKLFRKLVAEDIKIQMALLVKWVLKSGTSMYVAERGRESP